MPLERYISPQSTKLVRQGEENKKEGESKNPIFLNCGHLYPETIRNRNRDSLGTEKGGINSEQGYTENNQGQKAAYCEAKGRDGSQEEKLSSKRQLGANGQTKGGEKGTGEADVSDPQKAEARH